MKNTPPHTGKSSSRPTVGSSALTQILSSQLRYISSCGKGKSFLWVRKLYKQGRMETTTKASQEPTQGLCGKSALKEISNLGSSLIPK